MEDDLEKKVESKTKRVFDGVRYVVQRVPMYLGIGLAAKSTMDILYSAEDFFDVRSTAIKAGAGLIGLAGGVGFGLLANYIDRKTNNSFYNRLTESQSQ